MYNYSTNNNSFLANIPNQLMQIENLMGGNNPNKMNYPNPSMGMGHMNYPNNTMNYPQN
jgi:hypothetical protein